VLVLRPKKNLILPGSKLEFVSDGKEKVSGGQFVYNRAKGRVEKARLDVYPVRHRSHGQGKKHGSGVKSSGKL
jgi:hypothetical protein